MKFEAFLTLATKKLEAVSIGSARLDVLIMLEDELSKDRSYVLAHPEAELSPLQLKKLNKKLLRRVNHEPMAYIRGFSEFYGRKFKINHRVLEPRPESETMIDLLKSLHLPNDAKIADVGTGSGALGITAALELHNHNVDLFDIDASALAVAKHNCELHELHLRTTKRDLLKNDHKAYDVILANLPYVPNHWRINEAAAMEPRIAIFGGKDGLEVYRRFFEQLTHFNWRPEYVFTESMPPQHEDLAQIGQNAGFRLIKNQDFIQLFET
ncbi:MAG TPA: HemK/PrmC family methyltransferase [Candidatus Saccharimonadales bacterium]|nr:HemK/PrmC family methyltransferase [Candidatus Saccharimonadales bacterium]